VIDNAILLGGIALAGISFAVLLALLRAHTERQAAHQADQARKVTPATAEPVTNLPTRLLTPPPVVEDGMDWLAQAADELRTPLSVLRNQAEFLHQHVSDAARPTLLTLSERLVQQVEQAQGLIDAWTATAHPSGQLRAAPRARPVELLALTRSVAAQLTSLDDPPFDIAAVDSAWLLLDPAALEHALAVLLRGARQAAPGSLVEVVVRIIGSGEGQRAGIIIADRRVARSNPQGHLWSDLELDLARVLLEDYHGWLETTPRGGGGMLTTCWLPGHLLIAIDHPADSTVKRKVA
jgi:signal transduction histidine kinase